MPPVLGSIAVLGAGPAGAAAALGLARLGYEVAVIDAPALRDRRESFSARVVEALRALGAYEALRTLEPPGSRFVRWAGAERELAGEAQVDRRAFDAGLAADLVASGVRVIRGEAKRVRADEHSVRVELASGEALAAASAIDARGRAAPSGGRRERGPETTCLVQQWRRGLRDGHRKPRAPGSAVLSLENGWAWLADDGRDGVTVQLALDASHVPARSELAATLERTLRDEPFARDWLGDATPHGEPFARAATAVLSAAHARARTLRVGDAALAVDPLSGNGVFQALSTALVAPAVVNTLLQRPERAALARDFYATRARDIFLRFARVTRDFHALGAAHYGSAFWRARAAWPDAEPAHGSRASSPATSAAAAASAQLAIVLGPVVCDGWIEQREVVVTPERPLGIWRVAGADLAPLVRAAARGAESEASALAALPPESRASVEAWLRAHRESVHALAVVHAGCKRCKRGLTPKT